MRCHDLEYLSHGVRLPTFEDIKMAPCGSTIYLMNMGTATTRTAITRNERNRQRVTVLSGT